MTANRPNSEREPRNYENMPSFEEMEAAGVYGPIFDPSKLPPSARHYSLSRLRFFYRMGDAHGRSWRVPRHQPA